MVFVERTMKFTMKPMATAAPKTRRRARAERSRLPTDNAVV
jgi:hypothetical protein